MNERDDENAWSGEGRLVRDPEETAFPNDARVARFDLAVNRHFRKNDQPVKETIFFRCEAWNDMANIVMSNLHRGTHVKVLGRLKQDKFTDKEGVKHDVFKVVLLSPKEAKRRTVLEIVPANVPPKTEAEKDAEDAAATAFAGA